MVEKCLDDPNSSRIVNPKKTIKKKNPNLNNNNSLSADLTNDFNDITSYAAFDHNYQKEIKTKLRSTLVYSILFSTFFCSPIGFVGLYFGLMAKKEISNDNYSKANKLITKADYANLMALIIGSVIFFTYFIVSILLMINYKSS